jgi:hypothetical protein
MSRSGGINGLEEVQSAAPFPGQPLEQLPADLDSVHGAPTSGSQLAVIRSLGFRGLEGQRDQSAPDTIRERRVSAVFDTSIVVDYLRGYKPAVSAFPWATALANELIYITRDLPEEWADKGLWIPYRK